jgi:hypothetical protein
MGNAWVLTAALLSATACIQSSEAPVHAPAPTGAACSNGEAPSPPRASAPVPRRWETIVIGRDPAYDGAVFSTPTEAPAPASPTIVLVPQPVYVPYGYGYRFVPRPAAPRAPSSGLPPVGGDWPPVPDHGPRMR